MNPDNHPAEVQVVKPDKKRKLFTRRDSLNLAGIIAVLLKGSSVVRKVTPLLGSAGALGRGSFIPDPEKARYPENILEMFEDIGKVRSMLHLKGMPKALTPDQLLYAPKNNPAENSIMTEFSLPEGAEALKMHINRILGLQFGKRAGNIVRYVVEKQSLAGAATFNQQTMTMEINPEFSPFEETKTRSLIHEAGHAISPLSSEIVEFNMESRVMRFHAYYKVLSQANEIRGKYLQEDDSYHTRHIMKALGQGVIKEFYQGIEAGEMADTWLVNVTNYRGEEYIYNDLQEIARAEKKSLNNIKFTKRISAKLGRRIFDRMMSGGLELSEQFLDNNYRAQAEEALEEIFAEMYADQLFSGGEEIANPVVRDGVEEILQIVNPSVDVDSMPDEIRVQPEEIKQAYLASFPNFTSEDLDKELSGEMPPLSVIIGVESDEHRTVDRMLKSFYMNGDLPVSFESLNREDQALMQRYANCLKTVYAFFPEVINGLYPDDISFDPDLHFWDTDEIAQAFDLSAAKDYVENPEKIPGGIKDIEHRVLILTRFIDSEAFKHPTNKWGS